MFSQVFFPHFWKADRMTTLLPLSPFHVLSMTSYHWKPQPIPGKKNEFIETLPHFLHSITNKMTYTHPKVYSCI